MSTISSSSTPSGGEGQIKSVQQQLILGLKAKDSKIGGAMQIALALDTVAQKALAGLPSKPGVSSQ